MTRVLKRIKQFIHSVWYVWVEPIGPLTRVLKDTSPIICPEKTYLSCSHWPDDKGTERFKSACITVLQLLVAAIGPMTRVLKRIKQFIHSVWYVWVEPTGPLTRVLKVTIYDLIGKARIVAAIGPLTRVLKAS